MAATATGGPILILGGPVTAAAPHGPVRTATVVTTKFVGIAAELAKADEEAKVADDSAAQAKARAKKAAVDVIKAAYKEKANHYVIRKALLDAHVLKGTVSKIITVLGSLDRGEMVPSDVKSLNQAYTTVTTLAKMSAASRAASLGHGATPAATPVPKITGKDGLKAIIAEIKAERDPDKKFELIGEWITRCTTELTALAKGVREDGEDE